MTHTINFEYHENILDAHRIFYNKRTAYPIILNIPHLHVCFAFINLAYLKMHIKHYSILSMQYLKVCDAGIGCVYRCTVPAASRAPSAADNPY